MSEKEYQICCFCEKNNVNASMRCSQCKVATYCSSNCQKRHWKYQHKQECQKCIADPLYLSDIFTNRDKNELLKYAIAKGAAKLAERGYPSLQPYALALKISTKTLTDGLVAASGEFSVMSWVHDVEWSVADRVTLGLPQTEANGSGSSSTGGGS